MARTRPSRYVGGTALIPEVTAVAEPERTSRAPVKITDVRVVGDYAVLEWENGESGGMSAYHRTSSGAWKRFMSGGGAFAAKDLEANGCPASIAKQLVPGSPG